MKTFCFAHGLGRFKNPSLLITFCCLFQQEQWVAKNQNITANLCEWLDDNEKEWRKCKEDEEVEKMEKKFIKNLQWICRSEIVGKKKQMKSVKKLQINCFSLLLILSYALFSFATVHLHDDSIIDINFCCTELRG